MAAAAAVLAVLTERTDTTNFIYCHRAAPSVRNSHSLQSWGGGGEHTLAFSPGDALAS